MEPCSDMLVSPNVRLAHQIGEGGMGSVWVADHLSLGTKVAVKFTTASVVRRRPALVERFKREAGIAAKIKSPHVVQVFDHGLTQDGTPYIVMELLEGENLSRRLKRMKTLSLRHTALVVSQTAQVLGRAHRLNVVHRDIKPGNLFLMSSEYEIFIKVLDFGIAKFADLVSDVSTTATGTVMGSPLYMSPEQFLSAKDVDTRADLWSLAVVAYQALTGKPPFAGETMGQVMLSAMNRTGYRSPCERNPELPGSFDDWFAKAFAERIAERFQSADELAQSFIAIANEGLEASMAISYAIMPPPQAPSAERPRGSTAGRRREPGTATDRTASPAAGRTATAQTRRNAPTKVEGERTARDGDPAEPTEQDQQGAEEPLEVSAVELVEGPATEAPTLPEGDPAELSDGVPAELSDGVREETIAPAASTVHEPRGSGLWRKGGRTAALGAALVASLGLAVLFGLRLGAGEASRAGATGPGLGSGEPRAIPVATSPTASPQAPEPSAAAPAAVGAEPSALGAAPAASSPSSLGPAVRSADAAASAAAKRSNSPSAPATLGSGHVASAAASSAASARPKSKGKEPDYGF